MFRLFMRQQYPNSIEALQAARTIWFASTVYVMGTLAWGAAAVALGLPEPPGVMVLVAAILFASALETRREHWRLRDAEASRPPHP